MILYSLMVCKWKQKQKGASRTVLGKDGLEFSLPFVLAFIEFCHALNPGSQEAVAACICL